MLTRVAAVALLLLQGGILSAPALCLAVEQASAHDCEAPAPAPLSIASQDDASAPRCLGSILCLRPSIAPAAVSAEAAVDASIDVRAHLVAPSAPSARPLAPPFHPPRA